MEGCGATISLLTPKLKVSADEKLKKKFKE